MHLNLLNSDASTSSDSNIKSFHKNKTTVGVPTMERFVPRIELRVLIAIKKRHNLVQNPANRRNTIILTIIPAVLILSLIALISVNCESSIANLSFELKKGKCCFYLAFLWSLSKHHQYH